jgi:hypothetical protein
MFGYFSIVAATPPVNPKNVEADGHAHHEEKSE